MNIKLELLKSYIYDYIDSHLDDFEIDAKEIADTTAIKILSQIQEIIKNEDYDDFDAMEEIVSVFQRYGISCGSRHDF